MASSQNSELYEQSITILPLQPVPNQTSTFTINESDYSFTVRWLSLMSCWSVDIASADGTVVAAGVKLIPDVNLLAWNRELLRLFGQYLVCIELKEGDYKVFDNLGSSLLLGLVSDITTSYDGTVTPVTLNPVYLLDDTSTYNITDDSGTNTIFTYYTTVQEV